MEGTQGHVWSALSRTTARHPSASGPGNLPTRSKVLALGQSIFKLKAPREKAGPVSQEKQNKTKQMTVCRRAISTQYCKESSNYFK